MLKEDVWFMGKKRDVSVFLDTTTSFHVLIEYALDNSHRLSWRSGKTSGDLHGSHSGAIFNLGPWTFTSRAPWPKSPRVTRIVRESLL